MLAFDCATTYSCRCAQTTASSLRSLGVRPCHVLLVAERLMFTTSGLTATACVPQPEARDRNSMPRKIHSANPQPPRLSTLPKRMCATDGAMPAYCASRKPLPAMVPVTCVPCPFSSTHRSASSSLCSLETKLAPQMLCRRLAMSRWLVLRPVSSTPMGTAPPPVPRNNPGASVWKRTASAPIAGTAVSCAARKMPIGSTASTKSAWTMASKAAASTLAA